MLSSCTASRKSSWGRNHSWILELCFKFLLTFYFLLLLWLHLEKQSMTVFALNSLYAGQHQPLPILISDKCEPKKPWGRLRLKPCLCCRDGKHMDVSASDLGTVPETEIIQLLLFYLLSPCIPWAPCCSSLPSIAKKQETKQCWGRSCLDAGVPLGNYLFEIFCFLLFPRMI